MHVSGKHSQCLISIVTLGYALIALPGLCLAISSGEKPSALQGGGNQSGVVEGTVVYRADKQRPWRYARYYVKKRDRGQLAESVVVIRSDSRGSLLAKKRAPVIVDQRNFQFTPETIAIRVGDRVKFLNNDKGVHNVHSRNPRHAFNISIPSGGDHTERFMYAGGIRRPYRIGCVYHSAMRSWIFVFDHPHYQVTKADGHFSLDKIPPGEYMLEMVHPAGKLSWSRKIKVRPEKKTFVDIVVSSGNRTEKRPRE